MRTTKAARRCLSPPPYPWTSSQRAGARVTKIHTPVCPVGIEADVADDTFNSPGNGTSAFEGVLRQLPSDARSQLAGALVEGKDICSGNQPTLAAGRLSCKALRRVIDDGLQSLRLNLLSDTEEGPAPSLSQFPNVTSLTLSIDADWAEPSTDDIDSCGLLPGEQPMPNMDCRSEARAYAPLLLLGPLLGQPPASLRRLQNLTLVGQLTSFKALCKQLRAAFRACGAPAPLRNESEASSSGDGSESSDESDSSDDDDTSNSSAGAGFTANAAGSERGGIGRAGGGRSCSLAHLDLGNVRFPLTSAGSESVARGHAALGPLGLQELTLGVELLPGIQAHKELRRLHLYAQRAYAVQPLVEDNADCLQQLPLQHVSILAGERCDVDDFVAVLNALPDTVTSVCMAGPFRAALKLGLDGSGQAHPVMDILSAWPRGLPDAAHLTLLDVRSISGTAVDEILDLLELLYRAERVQCHTVRGCCTDLQELIPRLHTTPREVLLEVPVEGNTYSSTMTLRLAVGEGPSGGGGSGKGKEKVDSSDSGEGRQGGAAAGTCAGRGEQEEAGGGGTQLQLPAAEGLLARAVEVMEARARRGGARQGQGSEGGGKGPDPDLDDADEEEEEEEEERRERGSFEHWWRYGRRAARYGDVRRVLLLGGPGVSALAAHSTAEGAAALEGALGELLRKRTQGSQDTVGSGRRWEYMVFPGDGSILLHCDGGTAVEAAVQAVRRAAAAALGREVPEGGVRAVALPPCTLNSAWEGLNACARKVLQSEVRLHGGCADLLGQLQAVEQLWAELQAVWTSSSSTARPVPCPAEEGEEEEEKGEEQEAKPKACQPPRPRAPTAVRTRASRAAAAAAAEAAAGTSVGSGSWRRVGGGSGKRQRESEEAAGPGGKAEAAPQHGGKGRRGKRQGAAAEGPAEEGAAGPSSPPVGDGKQLVGRRTRQRGR